MVSNNVSDRSLYERYLWCNIRLSRYPRAGAHFSPSTPRIRLLYMRFHDSSILPLHYFNLFDLYIYSELTLCPLGLGWGNYMQDLIFNAQLAYGSGRACVF